MLQEETIPNNPFPAVEDGSAALAAFLQSMPPYLRQNLGQLSTQINGSYKHFVIKSDGEVLTFFGKRQIIRTVPPYRVAAGHYLLQDQKVRRARAYPRIGVGDPETVRPDLHAMWAAGKLFPMTGEQAGEIVKFLQYGKDNHNFSSYIFTPESIYSATATSFVVPIRTNLNLRMDIDCLKTIFTEMIRYPQFLIGTELTSETGYSVHEESILFAGTDWGNCTIAACDSGML